MLKNSQFPADLVTFTEEIYTEKLHFLWSDSQKVTRNFQKKLKSDSHLQKKYFNDSPSEMIRNAF